MRTYHVESYVSQLQNDMYSEVHELSSTYECVGILCAIPVAIADVALETFKTPLKVIEYLAITAMNLFGVAVVAANNLFDAEAKAAASPDHSTKEHSIKDALFNAQATLNNVVAIPVAVVMAPLKLLYQVFEIALDPDRVKSINYFPNIGLGYRTAGYVGV